MPSRLCGKEITDYVADLLFLLVSQHIGFDFHRKVADVLRDVPSLRFAREELIDTAPARLGATFRFSRKGYDG